MMVYTIILQRRHVLSYSSINYSRKTSKRQHPLYLGAVGGAVGPRLLVERAAVPHPLIYVSGLVREERDSCVPLRG